jgi:hypothetical protein
VGNPILFPVWAVRKIRILLEARAGFSAILAAIDSGTREIQIECGKVRQH